MSTQTQDMYSFYDMYSPEEEAGEEEQPAEESNYEQRETSKRASREEAGGPINLSRSSPSAEDAGSAAEDDTRRLFVGGIGWGITQDDLETHFSRFGGVEQVTVKTDPTTGRSRGFAFIRFSDRATVDAVLDSRPHVINGTQVEPNRVKARNNGNNKIFVGGLDPDFPEDELRKYFERFGKVDAIELPYDKVRNQRKKFSFVTFESEDVVEQVCKRPRQRIGDSECDVKRAIRRQNMARRGGAFSYERRRGDYGGGGGRSSGGYGSSSAPSSSYGRSGSSYGQNRKYSGQRSGSSTNGYSSRTYGSQNSGGYSDYSHNGYGH